MTKIYEVKDTIYHGTVDNYNEEELKKLQYDGFVINDFNEVILPIGAEVRHNEKLKEDVYFIGRGVYELSCQEKEAYLEEIPLE